MIVHQKRSSTGDVGYKLKQRGYELDVKRPVFGEKLPFPTQDIPDELLKLTDACAEGLLSQMVASVVVIETLGACCIVIRALSTTSEHKPFPVVV